MATQQKWRPFSVVILAANVLFLLVIIGEAAGGADDECICPFIMTDCGTCPGQDAKILFVVLLILDVILGAAWLLTKPRAGSGPPAATETTIEQPPAADSLPPPDPMESPGDTGHAAPDGVPPLPQP